MAYDIISKFQKNSPLPCWKGYRRKPGTSRFSKGSCVKKSPARDYVSDEQRKAVWASKADGGAGNPNKAVSPVKAKVKKVKAKGGGTKKVCLPLAKIRSMSKAERQKVIRAKRSAAAKGKYKRSSKSNVTGTSSGGSLKTWVKQDWRQVGNPSKKCGEK